MTEEEATNALVRVSDVTRRYERGGRSAVDRVSLTVAAGEAVAVMGASGSGKSTLLNLIAGLDRPDEGSIIVAGQRIDDLSETGVARFRRARVGMIFQFFNLLDDLTVLDNVLLPAQLAGLRRAKARARAEELLATLRIDRHRDAYPGRLSGGEQQRVGEEIGELLLDLNASGQTLILVTHDPGLAARYTHRIVRLRDGRVASDTGGSAGDGGPAADGGSAADGAAAGVRS
jgi:putative ABC transport system ATP-binding protein